MEPNTVSLFAANAIILVVLAGVFCIAGRGGGDGRYWRSWALANVLLAAALATFLLERRLPPLLVSLLPNVLLVIGFSVRWKAAREFAGRPVPGRLLFGPALLFTALCSWSWLSGSYGPAYTVANTVLAGLAFAVAWEFWRDRDDALPSRYGLVASYALIGLSFAFRIGQGLVEGPGMGMFLPHDAMLTVHLVIATIHSASSGGFALSIAYERNAAGLRHAAAHDFLTGALNRGAFEERLRATVAEGAEQRFALVLFDIDHFKEINDRHGHAAGDAAIRTCASVIRDCLGPGDTLARVGGEEFAVILKDAGPQKAHGFACRVGALLRGFDMTHFDPARGRARFRLTVSAGLCHSAQVEPDFDTLVGAADKMLYRAKNRGRDRVEAFAA